MRTQTYKIRPQTEEKYNLIAKRFKELGIPRRVEAAEIIGPEMGIDPTLVMKALLWKFGKISITEQNKSRDKEIIRTFNKYPPDKKSKAIKYLSKKLGVCDNTICRVVKKYMGRRKFVRQRVPRRLIRLHCGIYVKDNIMGNYMRGRL